MNLGKTILELRRQKHVTQEDLAAELGVTAAAVSKWENGYTLPDILMLCALADFFAVTTDELLGRDTVCKRAVVVAEDEELGSRIAELAAKYSIKTIAAFTDHSAARTFEAAHRDEIQYMFTALEHPLEEAEMDEGSGVIHVNVHKTGGSVQDILNGIELYLKNEDAFKNIANVTATGTR